MGKGTATRQLGRAVLRQTIGPRQEVSRIGLIQPARLVIGRDSPPPLNRCMVRSNQRAVT